MIRIPRIARGFASFPGRWRRFALYGSAAFLFCFFVLSLAPLTSPLPPYTGLHEVGILDVEVEIKKRRVAEGVLRETGEQAFEVR
jgi:platelet-activating factor acetylhydrolase